MDGTYWLFPTTEWPGNLRRGSGCITIFTCLAVHSCPATRRPATGWPRAAGPGAPGATDRGDPTMTYETARMFERLIRDHILSNDRILGTWRHRRCSRCDQLLAVAGRFCGRCGLNLDTAARKKDNDGWTFFKDGPRLLEIDDKESTRKGFPSGFLARHGFYRDEARRCWFWGGGKAPRP